MPTRTSIALGKSPERNKPIRSFPDNALSSRAGRFGTKGLAITFVSSDGDQQVMDAIQARFEVAMTELPDSIDPASYSECAFTSGFSKSSQCAEPRLVTS